MAMTGDFVEKYGIFLAPGGANHGTPIIATRDVAEMMVGGALYEGTDNLLIEAGGPAMADLERNRRYHRQENGAEKSPDPSDAGLDDRDQP